MSVVLAVIIDLVCTTFQEVAGVSVEIGNYLRQARESEGLSLDEVQEKTRIQKSFLEAIEKGDFDKLPSPFYVRTYLRSYANCVKVEPHYILREYRKKEQAERYQTGQFDVSGLTQQLNKVDQTGMHRFGLTGTFPKIPQTNTKQSVINRTSAKTALTIANSGTANTGKPPTTQRRVELDQALKAKVLSNSTNPERKFSSLLPSQALTTSTGSNTSRERQVTTENPETKQSISENRTSLEQTVPTQKFSSRLQKQQTSPQESVKQTAQFVPSRLNKVSESSGTLSRTQAIQKQSQLEEQNTQQTKQETNPLSRTSRFRSTSTLPTIKGKSRSQNIVEEENTNIMHNTFPKESRLSRDTGGNKQLAVVSQEVVEVQPLRRSSVRNRPAKSKEGFFSTRVIIASIAAVLILVGVSWYLFSDDGKSEVVQEKPPISEPTSEQKPLPASSSPKEKPTTTSSSTGDIKKESAGLYTLTGTDKISIAIKPTGDTWVQIRNGKEPTTDPKKYLKDVTLTAKDSIFKYDYTFSDVPDLYISIGIPDQIEEVTVNGIKLSSTRIIHIVKK